MCSSSWTHGKLGIIALDMALAFFATEQRAKRWKPIGSTSKIYYTGAKYDRFGAGRENFPI